MVGAFDWNTAVNGWFLDGRGLAVDGFDVWGYPRCDLTDYKSQGRMKILDTCEYQVYKIVGYE